MKSMRIAALAAFVIVGMFCASCNLFEKNYAHRITLQEGKTYRINSRIRQEATFSIRNQKYDAAYDLKIVSRQKVLNVASDGIANVEVSYESVKGDIVTVEGTYSYNSEEDVLVPAVFSLWAELINKSFRYSITPWGEVLNVSGGTKMIEELNKKYSNLPPQSRDDFAARYTDEALKELFEQTWRIFPKESMKVGDTYNSRMALDASMPLVLNTSLTLYKRENGMSFYKNEGTIQPNLKSRSRRIGNVDLKFKLNGSYYGDYRLHESDGFSGTINENMDLSGTVSVVSKNFGGSYGIKIVSSSEEKIELE